MQLSAAVAVKNNRKGFLWCKWVLILKLATSCISKNGNLLQQELAKKERKENHCVGGLCESVAGMVKFDYQIY